MNLRQFIPAALVVLSPGAVIAQTVDDTAATPISLTEAIRLAEQNSVSTVQARGSIRTSSAAGKQSYAAFLPSFSVSASRQRQSGDRFDTQGNLVPFTGQPTNYSTGLSRSHPRFIRRRSSLLRCEAVESRCRCGRSRRDCVAFQRRASGEAAVLQHPGC